MMTILRRRIVTLSVASLIACLAAGQDKTDSTVLKFESAIPMSAALPDLITASRENASILLVGHCGVNNVITDTLVVPQQQSFRTLKDALVAVSNANPGLAVSDDDHMWRVEDAGARSGLLQVKIPDLRVRSYSSSDAEGQIMRSEVVQKFFKEHKVRWAASGGGLTPVSPALLPHKSLALHNVTVAEALDQVIKQYPGVWLYRECQRADGMQLVQFETYRSLPR